MDEADRLLDMGFMEQVQEIVRHCPRKRQTLLFSATMTEDVEKLAALSLQRPVRISAQADGEKVAPNLVQEFVRVRHEYESEMEAMALYLLAGTLAKATTIVFVQHRKQAHRLAILLQLAGHEARDLRGDMAQTERLQALDDFRTGRARILVSTNLAARGLDIPDVQAVLNVNMPRTSREYIHRVGRTARAGRGGRSISLVTDKDRPVVKAVVREQSVPAVRRKLVPERIRVWADRIKSWAPFVREILEEEKVEAATQDGLLEVKRLENIIEHQKEILARPDREWFQSKHEKKELQKRLLQEDMKFRKKADGEEDGDDEEDANKNKKLSKKEKREKREREEGPISAARELRKMRKEEGSRKKRRLRLAKEAVEAMKVKSEKGGKFFVLNILFFLRNRMSLTTQMTTLTTMTMTVPKRRRTREANQRRTTTGPIRRRARRTRERRRPLLIFVMRTTLRTCAH